MWYEPELELTSDAHRGESSPALVPVPSRSSRRRSKHSRVVAVIGHICTSLAFTGLTLAALLTLALVIGPHVLPYRTYAVQTGSMRPTIAVGSQIVLFPADSAKLGVGDIITFARPGTEELVTHRIIRLEHDRGSAAFVTKGDANGVPDTWRVPATGSGWRYAFSVPYAGYAVAGLDTPVARSVLAALIALVVAQRVLARIVGAPRLP